VILVRAATAADAEAMSDVLVASITALCVEDHQNRPDAVSRWLANKTPDSVRQMLASPQSRFLVALVNDEIAAVGCYSYAREIRLNYVSPAHRFTGVSKTLLRAMEVELGPGEATLTSTATAYRFYRSMGWSDSAAVERYAGMVAYPMRKML